MCAATTQHSSPELAQNQQVKDDSYRHLDPTNEYSAMQMEMNRLYLEFWLNHPPSAEVGQREHVEVVSSSTSNGRAVVRKDLDVALMLQRLPSVARLAMEKLHLCPARLRAIARQTNFVQDLGKLRQIDEAVTNLLTPRTPDEALIQPGTITTRVREIVTRIDQEAATLTKRQNKRGGSIRRGEEGFTRVSMLLRNDEALEVRLYLDKALRKLQQREWKQAKAADRKPEQLNFADAFLDMVRNNTKAKVTFNLFEDANGSTYLNGVGMLDQEEREEWMTRVNKQRTLNLQRSHSQYEIPEEIRTTVEILDGICRFPGCDVDATECQKDHMISFELGGETCVDNLFCLCPFHHNAKTEQVANYTHLSDRSLLWTFKNGVQRVTHPQQVTTKRRFWGATNQSYQEKRVERHRKKVRGA